MPDIATVVHPWPRIGGCVFRKLQHLLRLPYWSADPQAISVERFPYYGHFHGSMGMRLLSQEFKSFREKTHGYVDCHGDFKS